MATLCETEDARAAREAYNLRSSAEFAPNYGNPDLHVALPCPAGVVWVDLSDLSDQGIDQTMVRGARTTVVQPRGPDPQKQYSPIAPAAASPDPHWAPGGGRGAHRGMIGKGGMMSRGLMARGGPATGAPMRVSSTDAASRNRRSGFTRRFRRSRVNSMEETSLGEGASQSSLDLDQKGRGADEEEEQVLELLNFELPPKRGAEDAKAAATRSACIREEYVAQEMAVRQMWKIAMGNAPGLKAEIAKLHATERAKLALREFELAEHSSATWQREEPPGSPTTAPPSPPSSDSRALAAVTSSEADAAANPQSRSGSPLTLNGDARNRRSRNGPTGVFGWVFGNFRV